MYKWSLSLGRSQTIKLYYCYISNNLNLKYMYSLHYILKKIYMLEWIKETSYAYVRKILIYIWWYLKISKRIIRFRRNYNRIWIYLKRNFTHSYIFCCIISKFLFFLINKNKNYLRKNILQKKVKYLLSAS